MKFTKMQGTGNDFIIINNIEEKIPKSRFSEIAAALCRRRLSVGADGMMFVDEAVCGGDYHMYFYNDDGSESEMCGNGARCIARYGYEKGLAGKIQHIETKAGIVVGERISGRLYKVRLNDASVLETDRRVSVDGMTYVCGYAELGNPGIPHAVVEIQGLRTYDEEKLRMLGRKLRNHPAFPKGANVNFYELIGENELVEKTYERGVEDFTLACGTGSGSVAAILTKKGLVDGKHIKIHVPGGILYLEVRCENDAVSDIFLTGTTNLVAEGEVTDEDFFSEV